MSDSKALSADPIAALKETGNHDSSLQPKLVSTVPMWHNIAVDQLKVFRDAVRQLRLHGLALDLTRALLIQGESSQQWEYVVPIVKKAASLRLSEEDQEWLSSSGDLKFLPARLIVSHNEIAKEGISLPVVAFDGGEMTMLPLEQRVGIGQPPADAQTKGLFGHWGPWQDFPGGNYCGYRLWCAKSCVQSDNSMWRCATWRCEFRHKYDRRGQITKTDYRYIFDHCGC